MGAALLVVAGCGHGNSGFEPVFDQNNANLSYPAVDDEPAQLALHQRLTAAADSSFGPPSAVSDQAGIHRETWCRPAGGGTEPDLGGATCATRSPGLEELQTGWLSADAPNPASTGPGTASVEVRHDTDRYNFQYVTAFEGYFELGNTGLGTFPIVSARYTLEVPDTNLPAVFSQPVADSVRADLLAYLASPEDLTAHATAKLETLRTQTQQWLDLPHLRRTYDCEVEQDFLGEGEQTVCQEAELTDAERQALHTWVDTAIDDRIAEAGANAEALHTLLVEATLADRCPTCWG